MSELPPNPSPNLPPDQQLTYAPPPPRGSGAGLGLGITSLVLGILSFPLDYALMAGVLTGLVGLILGIFAARSGPGPGRVLGIVGLILCGLAMLIGIGCGIMLFSSLGGI